MNAEIEAMMAANKAAMEESQEEADVSQEEMATRLVSDISHIRYIYTKEGNHKQVCSQRINSTRNQD